LVVNLAAEVIGAEPCQGPDAFEDEADAIKFSPVDEMPGDEE
jgi:hypothetical protein